jgi:kynurenine 3-monooxygenase
MTDRIAIIGGGLSGSLLALSLAQQGLIVDVYEKRSDPRKNFSETGRSINLGLSKRGMEALDRVGLLDKVLERAVVMKGRVIHSLDGETIFQPYGNNHKQVLHSIDRNELNRLLLEQAEQSINVTLHFNSKFIKANKNTRTIEIEVDKHTKVVKHKWIIGADGAFSNVRKEMQRGERANFQQEFLEWGYKELSLPAKDDGSSLIQLDALHIWPREHGLIVSHPNLNGTHTLSLFMPFHGEFSFERISTKQEVETFFNTYFSDLVTMLPSLVDEWDCNAVGSLITTKTSQWYYDDWMVLVGDACHAQYPFYGQGMNSAFEDICVLLDSLQASQFDLAKAFMQYESLRRPHTDVLAQLSKENFTELKDKVKSPIFLMRKKLDLVLNRIFPEYWLPMYTMIAHTKMPYMNAQVRSMQQERIINSVAICIAVVVFTVLFW